MKSPKNLLDQQKNPAREIIVLAHNIRSTHNVGSILRTAEGFGVKKVVFSGYTPYPKVKNDTRLPFIAEKLHKQISKTALGAEDLVQIEISNDIHETIKLLKSENFQLVALEQDLNSVSIKDFSPPEKIALLLGEEVHGIEKELLDLCEVKLEIPMFGQKESFNVSVATGIALFCLKIN